MTILWEPAIYEHKAALIGTSPHEVSRSADRLVEAILQEHRTYGADYLTLGVDVYNVEAEAIGAKVIVPGENECPDIARPLFDLADTKAHFGDYPDIPGDGRFEMLLEAGQRSKQKLDGAARLRVAASGPVSIAAKLVGLDALIMSLALKEGNAKDLLEFTTCIAADWCSAIRDAGLEAVVFDSMAAPPMFSPEMYKKEIFGFHRELMWTLQDAGQEECELVIGGDTTPIVPALEETHATTILCDYSSDAGTFANALPFACLQQIRRNISPTALMTTDSLETLADKYVAEISLFDNPVGGTGILPYDFTPERFLQFRRAVDERLA